MRSRSGCRLRSAARRCSSNWRSCADSASSSMRAADSFSSFSARTSSASCRPVWAVCSLMVSSSTRAFSSDSAMRSDWSAAIWMLRRSSSMRPDRLRSANTASCAARSKSRNCWRAPVSLPSSASKAIWWSSWAACISASWVSCCSKVASDSARTARCSSIWASISASSSRIWPLRAEKRSIACDSLSTSICNVCTRRVACSARARASPSPWLAWV
ncbi:hypothetical protein D3C72_1164020 [compost metagenome]